MTGNKKKETIDYLLERFFKPGTKAEDYKSLLKLNVENLKNFEDGLLKVLEKKSIKTIKDLIEFDQSDLENVLKVNGFDETQLDAILIVCNILKKLIKPGEKKDFKKVAKISVMGMQNAGKTSFINYLMGKTPDEKFKKTEPTVSIAHKTMELNGMQLAIWDFGGQKSFREEYLGNPEEFFVNTEVLLYIVDSQDDEKYADAIAYFYSILSLMEKIGEKCYVIVDFHKYDPDVAQNVEFLVKIQWLEEKFKEILSKFNFEYEFMRSSIFKEISKPEEPDMAKQLKEIFLSKSEEVKGPTDREMLKNILYIQTKIYINLMSNFSELVNEIRNLQYILTSQGIKIPQTTVQQTTPSLERPPPSQIRKQSPTMVGNQFSIVSEIRELIKQKFFV
ncbi:MAG: ADP-ribosylation factor-like protein [Promethearchaeota archaeon]